MKQFSTKHVTASPHDCMACWKCVKQCPKNAIGKVGFLWHKHIVFKNPEACIGCKKCIKACPQGVFRENCEETQAGLSPSSKHRRALPNIERLLPLAFIATAITGIGLHIVGHDASTSTWHHWAAAHTASSILWLLAGAVHIKRHYFDRH